MYVYKHIITDKFLFPMDLHATNNAVGVDDGSSTSGSSTIKHTRYKMQRKDQDKFV